MNIQALMKQAQSLQKDMMNAKNELNSMEFTGKSEFVNITLKGDKTVSSIKIKKLDSINEDDIEMLEDMILIAFNAAMKKVDDACEEKLGKYGNAIPSFF